MADYDFGELQFEVVAEEGVDKLGLILDGQLPGALTAKFVTPGKWADTVGIKPGFRVLRANGDDLADMDRAACKEHLNARPLKLLVDRVAEGEEFQHLREVVADASVEKLGLSLAGAPPGKVDVMMVAPDSWAEQAGLDVGDRLLKVNGKDLTDMTEDRLLECIKARPLALWIDPIYRRFVAGEAIGQLGFSLAGAPPGRQKITQVHPDSWAELAGLVPGQTLVRVNGESLQGMSGEKFTALLMQRPLALSIETPERSMSRIPMSSADAARGAAAASSALAPDADGVRKSTEARASALSVGSRRGASRILQATAEPSRGARAASLTLVPEVREGPKIIEAGVSELPVSARSGEVAEATSAARSEAKTVRSRDSSAGAVAVGRVRSSTSSGAGAVTATSMAPPAVSIAGARVRVSDALEARFGGPDRAALGAEGDVVEFQADGGVEQLGLVLEALPPGPQAVKSVKADLWASVAGIQVGDVILEINGETLATMTTERFAQLLKVRPLSLKARLRRRENTAARREVETRFSVAGVQDAAMVALGLPVERGEGAGEESEGSEIDEAEFEEYTMARVVELNMELEELRGQHQRMLREHASLKVDRDQFLRSRQRELAQQAAARTRGVTKPMLFALARSGRRRRAEQLRSDCRRPGSDGDGWYGNW